MSRIEVPQWAMEMAQSCAKRSTCLRRAVGCVLLDRNNHVIATGYNGVAAGMPHCNEPHVRGEGRQFMGKVQVIDVSKLAKYPHACPGANSPSGTNLDGCEAIHAEQNAMLQCRDVREIVTCYVTTSPCMTCTKLLLNTGCQTIVFLEEYAHTGAKDLWESAGRFWGQYGGPTLG